MLKDLNKLGKPKVFRGVGKVKPGKVGAASMLYYRHAGQRGRGGHHQLRRQRPGLHDALGRPRQQARPQVRPPPPTPASHIRKCAVVDIFIVSGSIRRAGMQ